MTKTATLYTLPSHFKQKDFYVQPVTKELEEGVHVTTWKYDDDQSLFNFELKFPLGLRLKTGYIMKKRVFFLIITRTRLQK